MTKIEEVARIIEAALERHGVTAFEGTIDDARDAIKAMREPTEAMILAGVTADYGKTLGERITNTHHAMIDTALRGTE